jgi:DSBA-like thioredoxin domain-containing protein
MHLTVYGDFNCPRSYLASQRVDAMVRAGQAEVEWRAVERDPALALTGTPRGADPERWQRELAEADALAGRDEQVPGTVPALVSNTGAAVAAYAEAVADGVADELRRNLFAEIWARQRHVSSPYEVRQLVRVLMYPAGPHRERLAGPDLPARIHHRVGPGLLPRLSGCTISPDGGPLTTGGHQRIRQWRNEWLPGSGGVVPALSLPDGMLTGAAALTYLADLADPAPPRARQRAAASR